MPLPLEKYSTPAASCFSKEEIHAASLVVARFRKGLDATLATPEWQEAIKTCVDALELPNQRQGISFVQAILALPLESKRDLVKRLFETRPIRLKRRSAETLSNAWGQAKSLPAGATLSLPQWSDLKRGLSLRLSSTYLAYKNAQNLIYRNYEYIAKQAAKELCLHASKLDDCEQEGACGLLQAIDRIEPGKPFATYAFQWTRRRIRNFLMKSSLPISAPINLISEVSRSRERDDNRNLDTKALSLALRCLQNPSIEFSENDWSAAADRTLHGNDPLSPIEVASKRELLEQLESALLQLTAKQREVLALRFGLLNREVIDTLQGIARATGISRQQVARRERRALSKLESLFSPLHNEFA